MDNINNIKVYLRDEFELDDEDITEMIEEIFVNFDSLINDIENYSGDDKWDNLKKKGHSLKGASANVGANNIADLAKKLEVSAENKDEIYSSLIAETKENIKTLKDEYNK